MVVVLVLAGVAVLGAVVALAMGRGGELAGTHPDHPPLPLGTEGRPVTGPDVVRIRLPRTFWGYQPQVTDEALRRLASALSERDARVASLERRLHDLRRRAGDTAAAEPIGALHGLEEPVPNGAQPAPLDETRGEQVGGAGEERP